jgi:hypothetical protein
MLRDPVERAYSAYNNLVRDGRETESFENALQLEAKRMKDNWDMMWAYKDVGLYYKQVKEYMSIFSNVKVMIFEEATANFQDCVRTLFGFLGVDQEVAVNVNTAYSCSGKPKNNTLAKLVSRDNRYCYHIRRFVLQTIPRRYLENSS